MKNLAVVFNKKIKEDQQICMLRRQLERKIPEHLQQYCNHCKMGIWYYIFYTLNNSSLIVSEEEVAETVQNTIQQYSNIKDTIKLLKLAIKEADKYCIRDDVITNILPNTIFARLVGEVNSRLAAAFDSLTISLYEVPFGSDTDNG